MQFCKFPSKESSQSKPPEIAKQGIRFSFSSVCISSYFFVFLFFSKLKEFFFYFRLHVSIFFIVFVCCQEYFNHV